MLTVSCDHIVDNRSTTRRDVPRRHTTRDQRLRKKLLQLCLESSRLGIGGFAFVLRRRRAFLVRTELLISFQPTLVDKCGIYLSARSESSSISMASAASLSQFFSWFSFLTLCCMESICLANWILSFSLSRRYSSTAMSGMSSSSENARQHQLLSRHASFRGLYSRRPKLPSKARTTRRSSGATMSKLKPLRMARAVRPFRWT
jgi:hypothetical protein